MMDAHLLVLFVNIMEASNLSDAARNMKMNQANISYRLTQLEKSARQQLMQCITRRVELTEVGQRLYQHGCVIRDELMVIQESVVVFGKTLQGSVRLNVSTGFEHIVMFGWLIELECRYPDIMLDLLFDNRADSLLRDGVDVAARAMPESPQQMAVTELA